MPEHPQIKGSEHLAPDELGYDPETLEPILKFDQAIVDKYPRVIEGIKAFNNYRGLSLEEIKAEVERQYNLIKNCVDPQEEEKARFTPDGRLIDKNNLLAWKVEPMPKENIPEVLRPFVRCPIYYTIDDRSDKVKEKLIQRDIERQRRAFGDKIVDEDYQQSIRDEYYHTAPGFSYIPHLDIIIMPHWEEDNYYKTTLAHEVAHSILHQKTESTNEEENEKESKSSPSYPSRKEF
jgi:hypothetical protein